MYAETKDVRERRHCAKVMLEDYVNALGLFELRRKRKRRRIPLDGARIVANVSLRTNFALIVSQ